MDFKDLIEKFLNGFKGVKPNYVICNKADFRIEEELKVNQKGIYNEDSLKFELGIFLRKHLGKNYFVEFERNVQCFGLNKSQTVKKELDIVVFNKKLTEKYSIELKFPRVKNYGQTVELRRFEEDEQCVNALINNGFTAAHQLILTDDSAYYATPSNNKGAPIQVINQGMYNKWRGKNWIDLQGDTKYYLH